MIVEHTERDEDKDCLSTLDEPRHEPERALVSPFRLAPLEQRGQRQPDACVHVEDSEQSRARETRVRHGDGDSKHERRVEDEVGGEVDEAACRRSSHTPRKNAVDPVQVPVQHEETKANPPLLERDRRARSKANCEADQRDRSGLDARPRKWPSDHVEGRTQDCSSPGVNHGLSIPRDLLSR